MPGPITKCFPPTAWNYGLVLNEQNPSSSFEVVRKALSPTANPFTQDGTPIELVATAKKIDAWQLDAHGLAAKLQDSPVKSEEPAEKVTLIPMGAAQAADFDVPNNRQRQRRQRVETAGTGREQVVTGATAPSGRFDSKYEEFLPLIDANGR